MNVVKIIRTALLFVALISCISGHLTDDNKQKEVIPGITKVKLKSGYESFGTGRQGNKTVKVIEAAIAMGYRLFDTAKLYMAGFGVPVERVLGKLIQNSGVPREKFFIVTKIIPNHFSEEECTKAIQQSLDFLNTSYVDLVLIHSPTCANVPNCNATGSYIDGWKSLEALVDKGWIRSIGGSNFDKEQLFRVHNIAKHPISVLQNWFDPFEQDELLRMDCEDLGVVYMSYSTLGGTWVSFGLNTNPVLHNDVIIKISERHNTSSAEVVLQWAMAKGVVVIPSTKNVPYIATNLKSLNLKLTEEEMSEIDQLHREKDKVIRLLETMMKEKANTPNDEL